MIIVMATKNPGKMIEMQNLLEDLGVEIKSAEAAGVTQEISEDGTTLAENALKKARLVAEQTGEWTVADDSGLFVEALGGEPGVRSARWAGENASGEKIVEKLLQEMKKIPAGKRQAYFESVLVLVSPELRNWVFSGKIEGSIAGKTAGQDRPSLPYDLVFIPQGGKKTFAEMTDQEKNDISHRGLAFKKLKDFLRLNIMD
ncbi:MAG: RdgB/HAM1 family non-canonical purine NTP pyrophosphatase [Patescibacteria group bacterium]|jgi:XTP/dITP diphosphohydrolase